MLGGGKLVEDSLLLQCVLIEHEREIHVRFDLFVGGQQLLLPEVTDIDVAADVQIDVACRGADNDNHAGQAEHDRRNLAERHPLSQEARGENGGPDRHREFDRDYLCKRN